MYTLHFGVAPVNVVHCGNWDHPLRSIFRRIIMALSCDRLHDALPHHVSFVGLERFGAFALDSRVAQSEGGVLGEWRRAGLDVVRPALPSVDAYLLHGIRIHSRIRKSVDRAGFHRVLRRSVALLRLIGNRNGGLNVPHTLKQFTHVNS